MPDTQDLERLEEEGRMLWEALVGVGDFRPGMPASRYRKCSKRNLPLCTGGGSGTRIEVGADAYSRKKRGS